MSLWPILYPRVSAPLKSDGLEVTPAILKRAGALGPTDLRTLDAIHLATALGLGLADLEFLTYDARLARAARAQGLDVVVP